MPITDHPFIELIPQADGSFQIISGRGQPMLWTRVSNPDPKSKMAILTLALIDTGADECVFPDSAAIQLGHDLKSVAPKTVRGINSSAPAYSHTSRIEILGMSPSGSPTDNVLYTIPDTPIDFLVGGQNFLLGVRNFLSRFVLTIDYPNKRFSLRNPF